MSMFSTLEISGSALSAERQRAEVVAANMANAQTTHTAKGGPYQRKEVVFSTSGNQPFPDDAGRIPTSRYSNSCCARTESNRRSITGLDAL